MDELIEVEKIKQLGEKIRQARVIAKLSQEDLGKVLNFPGNVISRMELGQRPVRASELQIIAKATNKPVQFFFEEESTENHRAYNDTKIHRDLKGLSDESIAIVDSVIEGLRKKDSINK